MLWKQFARILGKLFQGIQHMEKNWGWMHNWFSLTFINQPPSYSLQLIQIPPALPNSKGLADYFIETVPAKCVYDPTSSNLRVTSRRDCEEAVPGLLQLSPSPTPSDLWGTQNLLIFLLNHDLVVTVPSFESPDVITTFRSKRRDKRGNTMKRKGRGIFS